MLIGNYTCIDALDENDATMVVGVGIIQFALVYGYVYAMTF